MIDVINKLSTLKAECRCQRCSSLYVVNSIYDARKSRTGHICITCKRLIVSMCDLTQDNLLKAFNYNEATGEITHRHTTVSGDAGESATFPRAQGYLGMYVGKKHYLAHRLIWLMKTGALPECVDHINQDKTDNRWCNLRDVCHTDNNRNVALQLNSSSGVTGVSLHKPTGKYRAYISQGSKQVHLGLFVTLEEAIQVRKSANVKYGYHANHGA